MLELYKFNNNSPIINILSDELKVNNSNYQVKEKNPTRPFALILGTDKDTRFLFKTAFEIWNYDVAEADDCEQGLSIAAFKVPDLVLIDSEIDFQSSLLTMKTLQGCSLFNECSFVFISGHAQESVRQTALSAGANVFLVKPIDFDLFEQFLGNHFQNKNLTVTYRQ